MTAPALTTGHIVGGKYTIRRTLGRKAHAATYHALTAPSRDVALKLFDPALAGRPDIEQRLQSAVEESQRLPASIALPVIEAGFDPNTGAPFIATELSLTPSLAELVELCPLAGDELVAFVRSLGAALDTIHARGRLHLALAPTNIFVGAAPRFDLRVADFGPRFVATPEDAAWAAPEDAASATAASDVYSAALVTILHAATRGLPEDRTGDALRMPATAAANRMNVTVDPRLDAPLAKALSPSPNQRYRKVSELAAAIAQALGAPKIATPSHTMLAPPRSPMPSRPPPLPPITRRPQGVPTLPPPVPILTAEPFIPVVNEAPLEPDLAPTTPPMGAPPTAPPTAPPPPAPPPPAGLGMTLPLQQQAPNLQFPPEPLNFAPAQQPVSSPFVVDAPRPSLPPEGIPGTRRRPPLVLIGIAAGLFLLGVVGVTLIIRSTGSRDHVASAPSAKTSASAPTPAVSVAVQAQPVAATSAPAAAPPPDPAPTPTTDAGAPAEEGEGELAVNCKPGCTAYTIDGDAVTSFPAKLSAGEHTLVAMRGAYSQTKKVTIKVGQTENVFVGWGGPAPAPAKKNCGKFLKRCD